MKKENSTHEIFDEKYDPEYDTPAISNGDLQISNLSVDNIDSLDEFEAAPIELSSDYWSPQPGETKKVIFNRIAVGRFKSPINDEMIDLPCAFFLTKENGISKQINNASKRLVGIIEGFNLKSGAALQITYVGKVKNKTNSFMSDDWKVYPLVPKTFK